MNDYNTQESRDWDGKTLEDTLVEAIKTGGDYHTLALLISLLPNDKKNHYRLVWKKIKEEKK